MSSSPGSSDLDDEAVRMLEEAMRAVGIEREPDGRWLMADSDLCRLWLQVIGEAIRVEAEGRAIAIRSAAIANAVLVAADTTATPAVQFCPFIPGDPLFDVWWQTVLSRRRLLEAQRSVSP